MSIPHTGSLEAVVNGQRCHFDGERWTTPDAQLTALLNVTTERAPKTHAAIDELARYILAAAGLGDQAQITSAKSDRWRTELPPGAVD